MNNPITLIFLVVLFVVFLSLLVVIYHFFKTGNLWRQAFLSKAPVSYLELMGMSLRKVPMEVIVNARIKAKHADLDVESPEGCTVTRLEKHFLAGGDVDRVVTALIAAKSKGIEMDFTTAAQTNLAEQG